MEKETGLVIFRMDGQQTVCLWDNKKKEIFNQNGSDNLQNSHTESDYIEAKEYCKTIKQPGKVYFLKD